MNDLFGETCPCCGRPMPEQSQQPFDAFWAKIPKGRKNGSKQDAKKAWAKLTSAEQTIAGERVAAFYSLTKEERIGAQEMHVSRYLNSKAFNEEVLVQKMQRQTAKPQDPLDAAQRAIQSGKRFLCTSITATTARALLAAQRVTEQQCRDVGVSW